MYQAGAPIGKTTMTQISLGFQFGGQVYKQIIFFEDARSMREFTSGDFEFGGRASSVVLNSSASLEISTQGAGRTSVTTANGEKTEVDSSGFVDGMAVFTSSPKEDLWSRCHWVGRSSVTNRSPVKWRLLQR